MHEFFVTLHPRIFLLHHQLWIESNLLSISYQGFVSLDRPLVQILPILFVNCNSNYSNWPYVYQEHRFQLLDQTGLWAFDQCVVSIGLFRKKSISHLIKAYWNKFHFLTTLMFSLFPFGIHIHLLWIAIAMQLYAFRFSFQNIQVHYQVYLSYILILKWTDTLHWVNHRPFLDYHLYYQSSFPSFEFFNNCFQFHFLKFELFFWNCLILYPI
jgi:hypothetical protein